MKKIILFVSLMILISGSLIPSVVSAIPIDQDTGPEPYNGQVLCIPDAYLQAPEDCLPLGPSVTITDMVRQGFPYPKLPLPAGRPESSLTKLDLGYAKINLENWDPAPIFPTLDGAISGEAPGRYLAAGALRYVSFTQRSDTGGGHYVMISGGEWMRASPADFSQFQGLEFRQTPRNDFGWIIDLAIPRSGPGFSSPELPYSLTRETVVQVYQMLTMDGVQWYQIGVNEWVEDRVIGQVSINTQPPLGVSSNRWIEVNLYDQTLAVYQDGELLFATLIATGSEPYFTQPGTFQIYQKKATETMTGAFAADKSDYYYLADVPWTMYFDQSRALHGAYWRALFGYSQSHGCVNLSVADSHWLYNWAQEGDWVYVWDPSGQTPTDPAFYTQGGA